MQREDWSKYTRIFGALLIASFLATLFTYALVDAEVEYEYDVAYTLSDDRSLGPYTGSSGAVATEALPFSSSPFHLELTLSWTPVLVGPSAETMTIEVLDPSGAVVATDSQTGGTATIDVELAPVPATEGPFTGYGRENVDDAATDMADEAGPSPDGWILRITRTTGVDALPETPDTDWSISGSWNGLVGTPTNVEETMDDRGSTTGLVALSTFGISLLFGTVLLILYLVWMRNHVEGWDRTSRQTTRLALGQKENDNRARREDR